MKDYLLSEVVRGDVDVSKTDTKQNYALWEIQRAVRDFDIEPRDMIYLPYKLYRKFSHDWQVVYFDNARYEVKIKCFTAENEADEFIKELKGEKDV